MLRPGIEPVISFTGVRDYARSAVASCTAIDLVHRVRVAQHAKVRQEPQFRTEFSAFCSNNGIKHELSSPYNPESNGLAEAAVKNIKTLITRCHKLDEDLQLAITAWRNMARADGVLRKKATAAATPNS